jgi:hypothetical protein
MVIKRISPLSAAKIAGLIYALIGLLVALLLWTVSMVGLNVSGLSGSPFAPFTPGLMVAGGAVAIVSFPIVNGFFGFMMALTGAWIYNIAAGFAGGLNVDIRMVGTRIDVPPEESAA